MKIIPSFSVGTLVRRYKRFLADIETEDGLITVHCPNTGRMLGCSKPGSEVWYSDSANMARKYRHTLEVVRSDTDLVGINTMRANSLFSEALDSGTIKELSDFARIRSEPKTPSNSGRFDFLLGHGCERCFVEVKNVTFCYGGGIGAFPDAVSGRALRHVSQLEVALSEGYRAILFFCVQHTGIQRVAFADDIHPQYGTAVRAAVEKGLEVLAYSCSISRDCIELTNQVSVEMGAS